MKLILVDEPDRTALARFLEPYPILASSLLLIVEAERAVARRAGRPASALTASFIGDLHLVDFDHVIADRAASIGPATLRSLDAIHLATAMELAESLGAFVTYDQRQADAGRLLGLPVVTPV